MIPARENPTASTSTLRARWTHLWPSLHLVCGTIPIPKPVNGTSTISDLRCSFFSKRCRSKVSSSCVAWEYLLMPYNGSDTRLGGRDGQPDSGHQSRPTAAKQRLASECALHAHLQFTGWSDHSGYLPQVGRETLRPCWKGKSHDPPGRCSIIITNFATRSGAALLTVKQTQWKNLRSFLRQQTPSRRPDVSRMTAVRKWCLDRVVKKNGVWARFYSVLCYLQIILLMCDGTEAG